MNTLYDGKKFRTNENSIFFIRDIVHFSKLPHTNNGDSIFLL